MAVTLAGDRTQLYAGDFRFPNRTAPPVGRWARNSVRLASKLNFERSDGQTWRRLLLQEALRKCDGNKAKAASMLGIPRTTLVYHMKSSRRLRRLKL